MGSRGATLPLRGAGAAPLLGFRGKAPKCPIGHKILKLWIVDCIYQKHKPDKATDRNPA